MTQPGEISAARARTCCCAAGVGERMAELSAAMLLGASRRRGQSPSRNGTTGCADRPGPVVIAQRLFPPF
jgi:hypothetical protein